MDEAAQAVAAERRDLANRLHDGPIQELTAAQMFLDSALNQVPEDQRDAVLERGMAALGEAIGSMRTLMRELLGADQDP